MDHIVFVVHLRASNLAWIVAACSEHVACQSIWRTLDCFAHNIKLPGINHIFDGGNVVKNVINFVVLDPVVLDMGHCDVEDATDAAVHEHFEFVQESLPQ